MASADTIVSEQESSMAAPAEGGHESPSFSMNKWPRGRPRNAVSRVGYISDDAGDESNQPAPKAPSGVTSPHEEGGPFVADVPSISLSRAGSNQSLKAKHARPQSRPRVQLMHLAVPTALGHVRPRVKPAESPREAPASSAAVKPRPAALSSMTSRQESFGRALPIRSRAPSQQDVAGHVPADFEGGDLHAQTSKGGSPRRASLTVGQKRSSLEASEQREPPVQQLRGTDSHGRGSFEAGGTRRASDSHRASVTHESNEEGGEGLKQQQPTQDRDMHAEEQRRGSRAGPPSRAEQVRRSFAQAFAAESERRAAALASRSSSRPISRVEGQIDQRLLAQRANVAAAAAEQLRRMTPPQEDVVSEPTSVKDRKQQEADSGAQAEPVEPQADHLGSSLPSASPGSRPLVSTQSDRSPAKAVGDLPAQMPPPTPPTAPPRDASTTPAAATEGAATQRHAPPQSLQEAQKEIKVMLEVEEQRRAAVSASRARSRIVSRAEGSVDPAVVASRADVAKAAAEQLRKLAEQTKASGKYQTAAPVNGYQAKRHAAATKIQAAWRGHRIRVWVNAARVIARFTKFALPSTKMSPSKLRQPRAMRPRCNLRTAGC
ncbi:hypothetical protein Emed_006677 [Eimeria media]